MKTTREPDDDRELDAWRTEWNTLGNERDFSSSLAARALRDGARLRRAAAAEVFGALVSTGVSCALVVRSHGALELVALAAIVLLFNGAWLAQFFAARASLFRAAAARHDTYVQLTRARLEAELRWTHTAARWTAALALLLAPWSLWMLAARWASYAAHPLRAVLGFGAIAGILAAVYASLRRRRRALEAERERFEQQYADASLRIDDAVTGV